MKLNHENEKTSDVKRFLEFYLGNESYAVELLKVKEVITVPQITSIPKCPPHVCGVIDLRGLIITVIDLRKKLSITPDKSSEASIIIFDLHDCFVGMMVDSIHKVLSLTQAEIKDVPDAEKTKDSYIAGLLHHESKLTLWINPDELVDTKQRKTVQAA